MLELSFDLFFVWSKDYTRQLNVTGRMKQSKINTAKNVV